MNEIDEMKGEIANLNDEEYIPSFRRNVWETRLVFEYMVYDTKGGKGKWMFLNGKIE